METAFYFDPANNIGVDKLQCVECKKPLKLAPRKKLVCRNGHNYSIIDGIPVLLSGESKKMFDASLSSSTGQSMSEEYELSRKAKLVQVIKRLTNPPNVEMRLFDNEVFLDKLTDHDNPEKFVVSVGGGPVRKRAAVLNLNIEKFPNVDIVGDAHNLPFNDNSVDGILIYAVFEHLEEPHLAAEEIYRVLKPGGLVFAETPFLQHYHGYPYHFQNYTLTGHQYLFRKLHILESGPIAGPFDTTATVILNLPEDLITNKYVRKIVMWFVGLLVLPLRLLDVFYKNNPNSFKLTTGTYIYARKEQQS